MTEVGSWVASEIRRRREERQWSQAELAERLGRTQTAVSYWEAGKRTPGLNDLLDLARAFDVDVDALLRARQPVTALLRATVERLASKQLTHAIEDLLADAESATMPRPELAVAARQPAYAANELLEKAHAADRPPIDVERLARRCGVLVLNRPFPDDLSGLVFPYKTAAVVGINRSHSPRRQRFSLAHELGHYLLDHHDSAGEAARIHIDVDEGNATGFDWRAERAANDFAADLLMPRRLLSEEFEETPKPSKLAHRFGVSELAMGYRLLNLGLR